MYKPKRRQKMDPREGWVYRQNTPKHLSRRKMQEWRYWDYLTANDANDQCSLWGWCKANEVRFTHTLLLLGLISLTAAVAALGALQLLGAIELSLDISVLLITLSVVTFVDFIPLGLAIIVSENYYQPPNY